MKKSDLFVGLIAAVALAACGGGGEPANDASGSSGSDASATQASATDTAEAAGESMDAGMDASGGSGSGEMASANAAADDNASGDAAGDESQTAEDAPAEDSAETETAGASAQASGSGEIMIAGMTGDPQAGRRIFTRCQTCHVIEEGVNRNGPSLHGIIGREAGTVEGFRYSDANANSGVTWTEETLFEYLENPRAFIPGTIMAFPGLRSEQDRADVIAYIKVNGGDPDYEG